MNKIVYLFLLASLVVACGSSEEKSEGGKEENKEKSEDSVQTAKADTLYLTPDYKNPYADLSASDKKMFTLFLGDSLTAELMALNKGFDSIQTQRQMMIYYRSLLNFQARSFMFLSDLNTSEEFYNMIVAEKAKKNESVEEYEEYSLALDYIREHFKSVDEFIPGLKLSCVAECTEPYLDLNLKSLGKKMKETEGEDDDRYYAFMETHFDVEFQPTIMAAKWFEPTWDLGGMSLLGSGLHTKFLQDTDQLLEEKNIFSEWIQIFRGYCVEDAASWMSFAHSKEKVLSELKSILKKVKLTESEKDSIRDQIKTIEEGKEEGYQFDCKTNDCNWG